jgi:predicted acetyltransferase
MKIIFFLTNLIFNFTDPQAMCAKEIVTASSLKIRLITPKSENWNSFIEKSCSYIKESWPDAIQNHINDFKVEYNDELIQRFNEDDRYFMNFLNLKDETIGLANCYIEHENNKKIFNIAEFYIYPEFRRHKFGTIAAKELIKFSDTLQVNEFKVEVDKDQERANNFWSSIFDKVDTKNERNIYYK